MPDRLPQGDIYVNSNGGISDDQGIEIFQDSDVPEIPRKRPSRKGWVASALLGILALTLTNIIFLNIKEQKNYDFNRENLFHRVQFLADEDANGIVDQREWREFIKR